MWDHIGHNKATRENTVFQYVKIRCFHGLTHCYKFRSFKTFKP